MGVVTGILFLLITMFSFRNNRDIGIRFRRNSLLLTWGSYDVFVSDLCFDSKMDAVTRIKSTESNTLSQGCIPNFSTSIGSELLDFDRTIVPDLSRY